MSMRDSRELSIPLQQYALNETRYRMLQQSDAARFEELMASAQTDVQHRWKLYEQMAALRTNGTPGKSS